MTAARKKDSKNKDGSSRWEYQLSKDLRWGNKKQRVCLLKWMNQKKFWYRKPTPDELVAECRRKGSGIYNLIPIDTREAARRYWRQAAQDIIRHVNVVRVNIKTSRVITKPIKAWVPVKLELQGQIPENNYESMKRVHGNPFLTVTIVDRARGDLLAWLDRYGRYQEVLGDKNIKPVIAAIKGLLGVESDRAAAS